MDREAKESRNVHLRPDLLLLSHLQLADPGAVPVRKASPLYEELPLWVALERRLGQWIVWLAVRARRQFSWQRGFSPSPVQNLLDLAFEGRALKKKKKQQVHTKFGKYCRYKAMVPKTIKELTCNNEQNAGYSTSEQVHTCHGGLRTVCSLMITHLTPVKHLSFTSNANNRENVKTVARYTLI